MSLRSYIVASATGIGIMMGHGVAAQGAEITVFSTNSPNEVLREIVPQFERSSGHKVTIVYDTPTLILDRIKRGESADLILINPDTIDDLARQGKVLGSTRKTVASISVGVAVPRGHPKPDISTVEAFKKTLLSAKAIARTETGVSGAHVAKLTRQLGIEDQVKAKSIVPKTVRLGDLLISGEADLAIQQIPELLMISGIDYVGPLPKELQLTTVTAVALFTGSKQPAAAESLYQLMIAPSTARIFKEKGMDPTPP